MITIKKLEKMVNKLLGEDAYLHNFTKKNKSKVVHYDILEFSSFFSSRYKAYIELNYNCEIIGVYDAKTKEELKGFQNIKNKKLDTSSLKDYERRIRDRVVGVESSNILGEISNNKVNIFSKKDFGTLNLKNYYYGSDEKKMPMRNTKVIDIYKEFMKKYSKYITGGNIIYDGMTTYLIKLNIDGINAQLKVNSFFDYSIELSLYYNKNSYFFNDKEVLEIDDIIQYILNKNKNLDTKVKLLLSNRSVEGKELLSKEENKYKYKVRFKGLNDYYSIEINFNNKPKASLLSKGRSKKTIYYHIEQLNERLSEVSHA